MIRFFMLFQGLFSRLLQCLKTPGQGAVRTKPSYRPQIEGLEIIIATANVGLTGLYPLVSVASPGNAVPVATGVQNQDYGYTPGYSILYGLTPTTGGGTIQLQWDAKGGLGAWSPNWWTESLNIPAWISPGTYRISATVYDWVWDYGWWDKNMTSGTTIQISSGLATQQNVYALARIITAEANGYNTAEQTAVGWTVRNRMTRDNTVNVADVAGGYSPNQYNVSPTAQSQSIALGILQGTTPDLTNGATHFYSPVSMPKEGDYTGGYNVAGGLEWTPGLSRRNYRPGWALTFQPESVPGVRAWAFKFYKEPGSGYVY